MDDLAGAISERSGFFDAAFDLTEYDPGIPLRLGDLTVRFVLGQHYVPAWGVVIEAPNGARVAYTGDTGPSDRVVEAVRGADLLLVEAALRLASEDDLRRGHLTADEAIDLAVRSGARETLLVHYPPERRVEIAALCAASGASIRPAVAGLTVTVTPGSPGAAAEP
jgi:ribonuclease BN (tRNA processing enzyme)